MKSCCPISSGRRTTTRRVGYRREPQQRSAQLHEPEIIAAKPSGATGAGHRAQRRRPIRADHRRCACLGGCGQRRRPALGTMLDIGPEGSGRGASRPSDGGPFRRVPVADGAAGVSGPGSDGQEMSAITDVGGIHVGQHQRIDPDVTLGSGWASGTTVVRPARHRWCSRRPRRCRHARDRPARPDQLGASRRRRRAVRRQCVRARCSRRGDALARGAQPGWRWKAAVPIVPAAVVYDLPSVAGNADRTAEFGYSAAEVAERGGARHVSARGPARASACSRAGLEPRR